MSNLLFQARIVSAPVENSVIGWWAEHYFFYVKHRDLDARDDFSEMMLDTEKDLSAHHEVQHDRYYHRAGAINWVKLCTKRVVEEYFRNEGEAWDISAYGGIAAGVPRASIAVESWLDSVTNDAEVSTFDVDMTGAGTPGGTGVLASEVEDTMRTWQFMRMQGLTDMSYEDYLSTFGIRGIEAEEPHKPELIRYARNWTYPANTVDPTSGAPSSAVSWAITERADKDRFFREPGFILGLQVVRPKVYLRHQKATVLRLFDDTYAWLPAMLQNDPASSLREVPALTGPLELNTDAYWVDLRDLLIYGEQFLSLNMNTIGDSDYNEVDLPTAGLEKRYVTDTDVHNMFATKDSAQLIQADGVTRLSIKGSQIDTTPGNIIGA